jgi:anti-sigma regulatory factor (Ser/Thr protein kinase)
MSSSITIIDFSCINVLADAVRVVFGKEIKSPGHIFELHLILTIIQQLLDQLRQERVEDNTQELSKELHISRLSCRSPPHRLY